MQRTAGRGADSNRRTVVETSATLRGARLSAQKARLVADQVRGKDVGAALDTLLLSTRKGAHVIRKLLESAIANAETNEAADVDDLRISAIFVDEGRTMKRMRPRAKGRAGPILKRSCHVTIRVADEDG